MPSVRVVPSSSPSSEAPHTAENLRANSTLGKIASTELAPLQLVTGHPGAAASSVANMTGLGGATDFIGKLGDGKTWIRAGEFIGGIVCLFFGVALLAKELGIGNSVSQVIGVAAPVGKVAKVAKVAAVAGKGAK